MTAAPADLDSTDPWRVLGVSMGDDAKTIKRAYKRLAIQFHPDMTTNKDSTADEKRMASDRFAKINWAYETAMGKNSDRKRIVVPQLLVLVELPGFGNHRIDERVPTLRAVHRARMASTDWRDFMPNNNYDKEDAKYDTGGDSFEKIFSDMFAGAAAGIAAVEAPVAFLKILSNFWNKMWKATAVAMTMMQSSVCCCRRVT